MIGENLLYLMVWMVIILVPVLNSKMLEEVHVSLENILIAWLKIAPYLLIFIIHNSLIAPRLLLRKHRYVWYLVVNLLTITAVFSLVAIYEKYAPYDTEPYILNGKASFTDLAIYWNILLGFFMTGLNMGIKLLYRSLRDEQQMEELKRQNLQAEMDYLRYQINPPFLHEYAQQYPRPDRHRYRIREKRRHRTVQDDAVRSLRIGQRNHIAQKGHPIHRELHRVDAHPLRQQHRYMLGLSGHDPEQSGHPAPAADRIRRKRVQARSKL